MKKRVPCGLPLFSWKRSRWKSAWRFWHRNTARVQSGSVSIIPPLSLLMIHTASIFMQGTISILPRKRSASPGKTPMTGFGSCCLSVSIFPRNCWIRFFPTNVRKQRSHCSIFITILITAGMIFLISPLRKSRGTIQKMSKSLPENLLPREACQNRFPYWKGSIGIIRRMLPFSVFTTTRYPNS